MKLIADFIIITGIVLNVFVLLGLFKIKTKQTPHKILIILWAFVLVSLVHFYGRLHSIDLLYILTFIFANGVRLFLAPLIYVYIKSIFRPYKSLFRKNLIHFVPFTLYFIVYIIPSVVNHIGERKFFTHLSFIDNDYTQGLFQDTISLFYLVLSLRLFYSAKNNIKQQYSNISNKDFLWIRNFVLCFLIVILFDVLLIFSAMLFNLNAAELAYVTVVVLVISMLYLGYYGLTQSTIFLPNFLTANLNKPKKGDTHELKALKEKLERALHTDKHFLIPELTLSELAIQVNIPERKLSNVINDTMHTTFYDLINSLRVEEAKSKLKSEAVDKYSITGIAKICGFNSKSSFYRIFKKETGLTPTQFKNNVNKMS
ncbi:AraC family transcriptional regulator [uncultured Algibacter sp.]|uniref:helix-turn-helix domain-containing protein n=1 Tax=uncultured Algibacter sp. TaxID=298659 RepID=UPI002624D7FF|nr:helix-turn-helix domain-containing protein [uncultured Algibacter sp.]